MERRKSLDGRTHIIFVEFLNVIVVLNGQTSE
jgi:hypothetical protein